MSMHAHMYKCAYAYTYKRTLVYIFILVFLRKKITTLLMVYIFNRIQTITRKEGCNYKANSSEII